MCFSFEIFRFSDQFRILSNSFNGNEFDWISLEERQDKNHHKILRDRDRFYIAAGGIANRLFFSALVLRLFNEIDENVFLFV